MNKNINQIVSYLKENNYEYQIDQVENENIIDIDFYINWGLDLNEKEYEKYEKYIDSCKYKSKYFNIYCWYDVSGFDYWINKQNENNYIVCTVQINKNLTKNKLEKLDNKIFQIYENLKYNNK